MTHDATVYLLDDEPEMLKALTRLLRAYGFQVEAFSKAQDFLAHERGPGPACLVLDVAMPELDGLEVQRQLRQSGAELPIVFLTGHGDIPMSVRAIKAGAEDFLTKPVNASELLRALRAALQRASEQEATTLELAALHERLTRLTPREREVLAHVVTGKRNKQIAAALGTGEQNIKVHRGRVMRKLGVSSLAELIRLAERLGVEPRN